MKPSQASSGHFAAEPASVEALDVRQELVYDRVTGGYRLGLQLAGAARAVELTQLHPFRVRAGHRGVDLAQRLLVGANEDERLHLPIAAGGAEVVPAVAADDQALG